MKKIYILLLALSLLLAGCSNDGGETSKETNVETTETSGETSTEIESTNEEVTNEMVTIKTRNELGEIIDIEVPSNPTNVAVLDLASLDTIDALGKGDSIKGLTKSSTLNGMETYYENEEIVNLGSVKEADLEEIAAMEPQVIFIGGRLRNQYETLSSIAPVVLVSVDAEQDGSLFESMSNNITQIAKIYGVEDQVVDQLNTYKERLDAIASQVQGSNALSTIVNNGNISVLDGSGRTGLIFEAGFENAAGSVVEDSHGDSASFETILDINPDYLFVLDRDQAIATEGASLAKDVLDNEIVGATKAAENENIVYLHPSVWYLSEGGLGSLDTMISDIESALQ